jgi:Uma2 family endonuclease
MVQATYPSVVLLDEEIRIPGEVHGFDAFRSWSSGEQFPERGRIDYLQGDIEIDMSPEDLDTHGTVKVAIAARLHSLVAEPGRGSVFVDRARVVSADAALSVEPDVVVVLWESLESGRIRKVPATPPVPGRYVELDGAPDLVVEVVSNSSVGKDRKRLPALYARAGVPELWLVDARGETPQLEIWALGDGGYEPVAPDASAGSWTLSSVLGCRVRLRRRTFGEGRFVYSLESAP